MKSYLLKRLSLLWTRNLKGFNLWNSLTRTIFPLMIFVFVVVHLFSFFSLTHSNEPSAKFSAYYLNCIVLVEEEINRLIILWMLTLSTHTSTQPHGHRMGMNQNPWCIILQIENPLQSLISSIQDSYAHVCTTTVRPLRY